MTVTACALLVALVSVLSTLTLARALRNQQRAHERERARLIDQVCHLAGKPWALPPREAAVSVLEPEQDTADDEAYDV